MTREKILDSEFSRQDAKARSLEHSIFFPLRLCAFAGDHSNLVAALPHLSFVVNVIKVTMCRVKQDINTGNQHG
jgi:hypothetical protein